MAAKLWATGLLLCLSSAAAAADRNPIGEHAFYRVDRNRDRTSSVISEGKMNARVEPGLLDTESQDSYLVRIDYQIDTYVNGRNEGTEYIHLPAQYFEEAFLQQLRVDKYYETEQFKVQHLGFRDATNMDGRHYPGCDILYFYDLKTLKSFAVSDFIKSGMDDVRITALVKFGVPVLGAVKLDLTGKYKGQSIKAGADYMP